MAVQEGRFNLVVGTEGSLEGFESHDCCPEIMQEFLERIGYRYDVPFVCASARAAAPPPTSRGGQIQVSCSADAYGEGHILKPELLAQATLLCDGDFLNVMNAAVLDRLRTGSSFDPYAKYFRDLRGMSDERKAEAIAEAIDRVSGANRFGSYAEVRLQGPAQENWSDTKDDPFGTLFGETD